MSPAERPTGNPLAVVAAAPQVQPAEPVLEIRGLSVDYGFGGNAVHAVVDCDLTLRRGEVMGLAGESGSGKSTLAMAAIRLLRSPAVITGGQVLFHSRPTPGSGPVRTLDLLAAGDEELRSVRWSEISVVLQSALNALNPVATIGAQFYDLLQVHRPDLSKSARWDRAAELLTMVGMTADRLRSYAHELSGGMRQRAMIAMALALEPQVMIMDEPTTALDVVTQRQILEELMELRDRLGFAALFITHDLSLLVELADEIAVMYAGRLMERAPAASLFRAPRLPYTYGLLHCFPPMHGERRPMTGIPGSPPDLRAVPSGCAFHPRCQWAMARCSVDIPRLEAVDGSHREVACWLHDGDLTVPAELGGSDPAMVGTGQAVPAAVGGQDRSVTLTIVGTSTEPSAAPPVLEGRDLNKIFWVRRGRGPLARKARLRAVEGVSISLAAGTVTAVVGESGSGKTTVARLLAKIITPDGGRLFVDGQEAPPGRSRRYASQVQMIFQDPFASLNPVHRIRHHLVRPLKIHHLAEHDVDAAVAELLERVSLEPPQSFIDKFPYELSGGQRQRVAIARTLAVRPRVLLADEPVSMLDVSIRLGVLNLLADLRDRDHLAILYVTHDIASARYLADTIVVMYAGQVVESAPSVGLTDNPAHPYTQLLLSAAPDPDRLDRPKLAGSGAPPSLLVPPSGCRFHPRCPHAMDICKRQAPPGAEVAPGHVAACWLHVDPAERRVQEAAEPATQTGPATQDLRRRRMK